MKKQYIIQKYVMAENAAEALVKSKKAPVHEIFIHNDWFQRNAESRIYEVESPAATKAAVIGFKHKKK